MKLKKTQVYNKARYSMLICSKKQHYLNVHMTHRFNETTSKMPTTVIISVGIP